MPNPSITKVDMNTKYISLFILGLLYSAFIALYSFVFLQLEHELIHLIWFELVPRTGTILVALVLTLCTVGLYLIRQKYPAAPEFIPDVKERLKDPATNKTKDLPPVVSNTLATLVILAAGAGVGPEAPLLAMIYSGSRFQADKLRYLESNFTAFRSADFKTKLSILTSNTYRICPDEAISDTSAQASHVSQAANGQLKKSLRACYILNGILFFFFLKEQTGSSGIIFHLESSAYSAFDVALALPLIFIAFAIGLLYASISHVELKFMPRLHPLMRLAIGAIAIFLTYLVGVDYLFSGQFNLEALIQDGQNIATISLIGIALLKLALLYICSHSGWRGGDIFPLTYASFALALALAQLIGVDPLLSMALIVPALLMQATHMGLIACIFVALFFPLGALPVLIISTALSFGLKKGYDLLGKREAEQTMD